VRKTTRNYILDGIFGLLMLFQGISGFVLWFVLPCGPRIGGACRPRDEFLFTRLTWIDIHQWLAVALVVMFAVHIFMHWRWIFYMTKSYCRQEEEVRK